MKCMYSTIIILKKCIKDNFISDCALVEMLNLQVQQTPKPLAQEPAEAPPLFVHSDLNKNFDAIVTKHKT